MSEGDLDNLLAELHSRLSRAKKLDAESREMLMTVSDDIRRALADKSSSRKAARQSSDAGAHESRLEALAVRFEADHPALAEALRAITDALAKAGI